ncbi:hypothetical protein Enr17x_43000 [Gimesia fumaroli]|uniref:Uncharacterized protein n=1 Tax=Gimesia fumaroli TaxID=2527976 RepID=A0A518IGR3_9PLAN|nr:hypothetical protein Enr17x_43000 [Gimesia fumaroli]
MNKEIRLNDSNQEKRNSERRPKLIEQMRNKLRVIHYLLWVRRYFVAGSVPNVDL